MRRLTITRALFGLSLIFVCSTCARNPVTGKKQLSFMSTKQEISLGQGYDPQVQATFGVYDDEKLQKFIVEKGMAMAKVSHRPDLPWQFKVVDSPVVNAFAVPGGYVYFTRGIMAHFNSEAQFAGVLGHEIGHVTARHGARQQTGQILGQLGLIVGMLAVPELQRFGDVANQGLGLMFLKFGRNHETESDKLGVTYSTKIGYDANHMADFFTTLKRIGDKSGQSIPTFLSTHPDPVDREKNVSLMARGMQQKLPGKQFVENRNEFLTLIDGIIYGDDPKQGFVENSIFYHPELKFQFPVPPGWQFENSPIQFQMASKDGKAMVLFTVAQGKTLEEAAQNVVKNYSLKVLESRKSTVNGLSALVMLSEQVAQQQQGGGQQQPPQADPNPLTVGTHLIEYNGLIYAFHGATTKNLFNQYANEFKTTAQSFRKLDDPEKLGRKPERIKVVRVPRNMTFAEAMKNFQQPEKRFGELAILNGMELTTALTQGMLVKTVGF